MSFGDMFEREAKKVRISTAEDDIEEDQDEVMDAPTITLEQYKSGILPQTNGQTGPGSIWLYAKRDAAYDPQSLNSHTFDPALPLHGYKLPEKSGSPCPYGLIAHALELIENLKASGSGSRKKTIVVLANLFRLIISKYGTVELIQAVYCIINKVGPDYEGLELGVGDQIVMRAMAEAYGRKESDLKAMIDRGDVADLGEAALESRVKQSMLMQPAPLTVAKVFKDLRGMAESSGKNSQQTRRDVIKKLLVSGKEKEAKFIVRTLQGKLRVGIQNASVLQSLANAVCLTFGSTVSDVRKIEKPERPENLRSNQQIEHVMIYMEEAVRQAFCEMPNYEMLIKALMKDPIPQPSNLAGKCHVTPLIPVKPMLAKPTRSVGEVLGRFTGIQFTAEYKYDGERAQIHIEKAGKVIDIFSRNSEHMTEKYPDVVETLEEMLALVNKEGEAPKLTSAIIDAEVVAFSNEEHKILPFQTLSTRARKNVKTEDIKVAVCLFPFDLIYLNGESLVKAPLRTRRDKLRAVIPEMDEKLQFAVGKDLSTAEEVEAFLGEAVDHQCEGLMIKTLDENASYEPSKRSLNWLKLKKDYVEGIGDSVDLVPIGGYRGKGKRTGVYGAFLLAVFDQSTGEFQTACKIGTGLSDADLQQHFEFFKDHIISQKRIDYDVHESLYPDDWFDAVQVWEVQAADLSISPIHSASSSLRSDGKGIGLRFPRFLRIRDDKGPEDATSSEQIVQMFEDQFKNAGQGGDAQDEDDYDL
jgi:DNA ligase-1